MSEIKIKFKKLHPDAKMPVKSTEFAGAYDVFCTKVELSTNKNGHPLFICYTGLAMQPPIGYRIKLHARSSISKYSIFLANSVGIGDADYTGEYQFRFACTGYVKCPYEPGDRIGQIYLEKEIPTIFEEVEELTKYDREGGFGSTGK